MTRLKPVCAEHLGSLLLLDQLLDCPPHNIREEQVVQWSPRR